MRIHQFLEHHGIARNPFAEEDAQTDPVFKEHCIASTYHPTWDKVYGDPAEPSTSIVFGEKGSGKTAMRLQIAQHLERHNVAHPGKRLYVIHYDDFNPFLDRFRDRLHGRRKRADRMLAEWKLRDHMDAILSLGVTGLVDQILEARRGVSPGSQVTSAQIDSLDHHQSRDLLLLAAFYDTSTTETYKGRWHRLRRRLRFSTWRSQWDLALGWVVTAVSAVIALAMVFSGYAAKVGSLWYLFVLLAVAGFAPWLWRFAKSFWLARGVMRWLRVTNHETQPLRQILMQFMSNQLSGQPVPNKDSTDDRYELLLKLQGILQTLGFSGIIVLVDRADEPHLINGSADLIKALLWPMLDNKFLKHPGLGLKLMLPVELTRFVEREDRDFYQRARLDKQNMIPSFQWTGEALFDVANARIQACALDGRTPTLRDFFDGSTSDARLLEILRSLRVPRHMFKFLYRVFVAHCNAYTDQQPVWQIPSNTLETTLAVFLRDQDAFDRGVGAG